MNAVIGSGVPIGDPKLEDVLDVYARWLKIGINCVKIGTIQSIDYTKMTASIQIVFQQALSDGTYQTIPALTDCPVFTPQGGGFSLQFPIAKGDAAIVLFADRNIDNWFSSGGVQVPADGRLHSLSDAIAIVGINSLASPLQPAPSSSEARFTDKAGTTKVGISGGKVTIAGASGKTLLTVLEDLITQIKAISTTNCVVGSPVTVSPASQAALDLITTELQGLLY